MHVTVLCLLLFLVHLARHAECAATKAKKASKAPVTLDKAECEALGFNSDTLKCATCDSVQRVVGEDLGKECQRCCTKGEEEERYSYAVLEMDKRYLSAFPETAVILRSIEKKAVEKASNKAAASAGTGKSKGKGSKEDERIVAIAMDVRHRYTFGARPTLHVYRDKDDTSPVDSLSVAGWTVDVFTDFFGVHAEKGVEKSVPPPQQQQAGDGVADKAGGSEEL